ncbi:hypothetical protein VTN77DRAFT_7565 [Rasamsonia byssochlamydoides]|uniref:uncharacterized protein n=1 Tax=Rasamsonia byssochlamydoides TaxID=89139 RepID=UPI003743E292
MEGLRLGTNVTLCRLLPVSPLCVILAKSQTVLLLSRQSKSQVLRSMRSSQRGVHQGSSQICNENSFRASRLGTPARASPLGPNRGLQLPQKFRACARKRQWLAGLPTSLHASAIARNLVI